MNSEMYLWTKQLDNPYNIILNIESALKFEAKLSPIFWVPSLFYTEGGAINTVKRFDHICLPASPYSIVDVFQWSASKKYHMISFQSTIATKEFDNDITVYQIVKGLPFMVEIMVPEREPFNIAPHLAYSVYNKDSLQEIKKYYGSNNIRPPSFMNDVMDNDHENISAIYLDTKPIRLEFIYRNNK